MGVVERRFRWEEIKRLTSGFGSSSVISEGQFSTVYLARFPHDGSVGAIKIYRHNGRLSQAFQEELRIVRRLSHPNVVRFIGYCDEGEKGVLVFEHVPNGTLHDHLHNQSSHPTPLPWRLRTRIAYSVACALQHLHHRDVAHGCISSSHVLLDPRLEPKLCDFRSADATYARAVAHLHFVTGPIGYVDPHSYLCVGGVTPMSDVYSFGVLVLELLTGQEVEEEHEMMPATLAEEMVEDKEKAVAMVDGRLEGEFDSKEVLAMVLIVGKCLLMYPRERPSMMEILGLIETLVPSATVFE
ncbi:hypothetical protein QJS10_CPA05g00113 [Acorus calamus]|uniref:Protein kinase domain-containing protein n=1 Tax=Acorus calamus TaxID=4465 RepID=A0AAV9EQD4_ACOCL|nr:hypothetical protein QJS10_CPA05g00113 [Acorus calamus]